MPSIQDLIALDGDPREYLEKILEDNPLQKRDEQRPRLSARQCPLFGNY